MSYGYIPQLEANQAAQTLEGAGGILVTKRSILSNPGTKLDYSLYYNSLNTVVQASECTWTQGRYQQSFSSLAFGSSSTIIIPNGSFVQAMRIHLELPDLGANMTVPRGWGFAAINNISFLLGSSNVPQITISGQTVYQLIMAQCETVSKRNKMLKLAGEEQLAPTGGRIVADLVLPLPFSSASGTDSQFPFDTNLLQNPILVTITFNPASAFIGGIGLATWPQTGFVNASAQLKLGDLLNKDQGLRRIMQQNPALIYGYPITHFQSYTTNFFGRAFSINDAPYPQAATINLTGLINADLLGIVFGVMPTSRLRPSGSNPVNPLIYDEVENVQLLFNGLVMHSTPKKQHLLTNMNSVDDSTHIDHSIINTPFVPGTAPFTSSPIECNMVFIDFAQMRSMNFHKEYENVWRLPNSTLTLALNTPPGSDGVEYILFLTYVYNGIVNVRGGETEIFFS